jgi:hypothetical protein
MLTTIDIEQNLWERAKIVAVMEGTSLKTIVNKALKEYLKDKPLLLKRKREVETPDRSKGGQTP